MTATATRCGHDPDRPCPRHAAAQRPRQLPGRHRRRDHVHRPGADQRPRLCRHVRPRLCGDLPRRFGGGRPALRAARARRKSGGAAGRPGEIEGLGTVEMLDCRLKAADVAYRVYLRRTRGTLYVAEGLSGYDSALRLGLRSLVADREGEGQVAIATTGAGDPAAFARVQASTLDPQRALAEAYRRNNAGNYADSFEFFNALTQRGSAAVNQAEVMVNEGLQKSNLGRYPEADSLFSRAEDLAGADPVTARRLRNYRAIQLADQGLAGRVVAVLDRPVPAIGVSGAVRSLTIDRPTAGRLSAESPGAGRVTGPWGGCEWERV